MRASLLPVFVAAFACVAAGLWSLRQPSRRRRAVTAPVRPYRPGSRTGRPAPPAGEYAGLLVSVARGRIGRPCPSRAFADGLFVLGLTWCAVVAAADAACGRHLILIGLLVAGPSCVLLGGRWLRTAVVGACAVALAVLCGLPDGIFGTVPHLELVASVVAASVVGTVAAATMARGQAH